MLASCTCRTLLLATIIAATFAQGARAESSTTAFGVLNLESIGVPPELGSALSDSLRRQLGQLSGAAASAQDMVEVKLVFGCVDEKPSCLARAGRQLGVARLIYGKLRPQPGDSSAVIVLLHQLHVGDANVENSVEEVVPARSLSDGTSDLDRFAQRWLLTLAAQPREIQVRPRAPSTRMRWNRGLWISSAVFGTLAGAVALAALGTWRGIGDAQDSASAHLDLLQDKLTANGTIENYQSFFTSSEQLSRCAGVPGLLGDSDYENYRAVCQRGNALATATTGLLAAAGGLAFLSVTSLILSRALRKPMPAVEPMRSSGVAPPRTPLPPRTAPAAPTAPAKLFVPDPADIPTEEPPPAGESKPTAATSPSVRLDSIVPAVSTTGAAVLLQLSF